MLHQTTPEAWRLQHETEELQRHAETGEVRSKFIHCSVRTEMIDYKELVQFLDYTAKIAHLVVPKADKAYKADNSKFIAIRST